MELEKMEIRIEAGSTALLVMLQSSAAVQEQYLFYCIKQFQRMESKDYVKNFFSLAPMENEEEDKNKEFVPE